ncbi:MAG: hypothetical protein Q8L85_01175 [Alphaproteobacteria bacterium]|nr:hypothetical protein [Alphaproteobacteria bacterium]
MKSFKDMPHLLNTQKEKPSFWIRDDDLTIPNPKMDQFLDICASFAIPVSLAVIPAGMSKNLKNYTQNYPKLSILQHGICHENKAIAQQKKSEFISFDDAQLQNLLSEKKRMEELFEDSFKPIFVPPWNRMDMSWKEHILKHYNLISAFGIHLDASYVNTHLDLINWKKRCFKTEEELYVELENLLKKTSNIGVLSHHFIYKKNDWTIFKNLLLSLTS